MTCGAELDVPEGMRAAALDIAGGLLPDERPLARTVICALDQHDHGEHIARLRDLFEGAVWVMWEGDDITVRSIAYCEFFRRSQEGVPLLDVCWLPDTHRGGHTWERCV